MILVALIAAHVTSAAPEAPPGEPPLVLAVDEKRGVVFYFDDAKLTSRCEFVLVDRARIEGFRVDDCDKGQPPVPDAAKPKLAAAGIDLAKQPKWPTTLVPQKGAVRWQKVTADGDDCANLYVDEKEAYHDCQAQTDMAQFGMSSSDFWFWRIGNTRLFIELTAYFGRDINYGFGIADAAARDADDPASYAGTNVDVAALRAIALPAECKATIAANSELRNEWGVTGAMAKGLSRDAAKKPAPVSTAKKHRKASVVYTTKACAAAGSAVAAKVPGGATVEPLTWKSKAGIVVALGADAQPHF